jgi:integrase
VKRDGLYKQPGSRFYYCSYTLPNGTRVRESTKCVTKNDAETYLAGKRVARANGALFTGAKAVTLADLQTLAEDRYRADGNRALKRLQLAWKALRHDDTGLPARALDVTTAAVTAYERRRLDAGRSRSTVNYELACLRRAWRLAIEAKLLPADSKPVIHTPTPDNARTGVLTRDEVAAITAKLPAWAAPVVWFLFFTGWRVNEALALRWRANVDQRRKLLRLEAAETKGGKARTFPFGSLPLLEQLLTRQRATPVASDFVFSDNGRSIIYKELRLAWRAACRKAKLGGRLMHDLRRSAASQLVEAGVDQHTIMELCGWDTPSMFFRYHIVKEDAKQAAVAKLAQTLEPVPA